MSRFDKISSFICWRRLIYSPKKFAEQNLGWPEVNEGVRLGSVPV